jgi:hypothetical protein
MTLPRPRYPPEVVVVRPIALLRRRAAEALPQCHPRWIIATRLWMTRITLVNVG